ncbi:MAG: Uma2 family endonuclease [Chitinophagales bacterium]
MESAETNKHTDTLETTPPNRSLLKLASFEELLKGKLFLVVNEQLLFEKEGKYVFTQINLENNYTAADYAELPEGAPFQLIQGKLIFMASPYYIHQKVLMRLANKLDTHVEENGLGEVLPAPMDVHFDAKNVYQPDILFVSVARKDIIDKFIQGAPDLVVEILSKSTAQKDETDKMKIYGKYDVLEYWMIHPTEQWVKVYENQSGEMKEVVELQQTGKYHSKTIEGFVLDVATIFKGL